ncbi:cytochrome b N-terminal domain-containing protein [bacterium]|nr:cytochrome b N-terminal domain-containing protein [bacterium]MBU1025220.1 cytochrome b N-terminal domain-containing protein [bacterium]
MLEKIYNWFDERIGFQPLIDLAKKKTVPHYYGTVWFYMGGVALFLFIVQVVTGVLLLFYYRPGEDAAYESVKFLTTKIQFGWLIRSVHSWSANIMILVAMIHVFSVFFTRSYKKPRELTWYSGFLLLFLAMGFGFSGYLLPWNKLAFFATKVGTDIAGVLPLIGEPVKLFLRGGEFVTGSTLSRFFAFHIFILPAIAFIFLGLHLYLVQTQGMSQPDGWLKKPEKDRKVMLFFPNFMLRDVLVWMVVLNGLALLSVFFPWELGEKAAPFEPAPAGIKPEWYFVFMFETLKMIPAKILFIEGELLGILGFAVLFLLWFFTPILDRVHDKPRSFWFPVMGLLSLLYIIILTVYGYMH